jgi:hypothetical protein
LALVAVAIGGAVVTFAIGEIAIAIAACLVAMALLTRAAFLLYPLRHADSSERILPPTSEAFLKRDCIRKLTDKPVGSDTSQDR